MSCPANTYTVDGISCIPLPSGIKTYSMISTSSETAAILIPLIIMIVILFSALFIFRIKNTNTDILNNVNEVEIKSTIETATGLTNPIHATRID